MRQQMVDTICSSRLAIVCTALSAFQDRYFVETFANDEQNSFFVSGKVSIQMGIDPETDSTHCLVLQCKDGWP